VFFSLGISLQGWANTLSCYRFATAIAAVGRTYLGLARTSGGLGAGTAAAFIA
jgi:hypothetical protein